MDSEFSISFWGVRGTVPCPGKNTAKYGGNTSCIEVHCGGKTIILDAGTGIYALGQAKNIEDADILLSHSHLDHIQGFPLFKPLYNPAANFRIWAGHLSAKNSIESVLHRLMSPPVFPVLLSDLKAKVQFNRFDAGAEIPADFGDITIKTLRLNHPDNATGYRLEYSGKSMCYVTDIEHEEGRPNQELIEFIKNTDIFIYDSTYDDKTYKEYKGWGHSTWQEGVRLSEAASVKKFIAFHHDPEATDKILDKRAKELEKALPGAELATEGKVVTL